ncbi:MAG: hypothetical protein U1E61_15430 [Bradyrhizobium sp.]
MGDYRAYILAIDGHRFVRVKDFLTDHTSDGAAVDAAKQLSVEHEVEVWQGGRLVARLCHGEEEVSPGLVPRLLPICDPAAHAEPISSSGASEVEPEPASKTDLERSGWRRFLIPWA